SMSLGVVVVLSQAAVISKVAAIAIGSINFMPDSLVLTQ
ncbi:MAG: hypothetical protein ACI9ON_003891, partial [Limisphaerales bacterium]